MEWTLRPEVPADAEAVRCVHRLAFGRDDEARLLDALRSGGHVRLSLLAELRGQVVGHVLFSDLPIVTARGPVAALALAPLAVRPEFQGRGIGSALVRRGLEICKRQGQRIVVVVGHPGFYPRFGFSAPLAGHLESPYSGRDSFMAAELEAGALDGVAGRLQYPRPFGVEPAVRPVGAADGAEWLRMRTLLWPEGAADHAEEIRAYLATGSLPWSEPFPAAAVFVAERPAGGLCGFLEASVRPYAEGCATRPVGYVEGWFVDADARRGGIGRGLVRAAERWAAERGCRELASDAHPDNAISLAAHAAVGFAEVGRAVHLRKRLAAASGSAAEPG
jgi:putative acetyltransferase